MRASICLAILLLAAAAVVGVFLFRLDLAAPRALAQEPNGVYEGAIEVLDPLCGGGTVRITVGPDGTDIRLIEAIGLNYIIEGLHLIFPFGPGEVPIVDGSFLGEGTLGPFTTFLEGTFSEQKIIGRVGARQFEATCAPTYSAQLLRPSVDLLGDVNCDQVVTIADAQLIAQLIVGRIAQLSCPDNADVDESGGVTIADAQLIAQLIVGRIPSLPPP